MRQFSFESTGDQSISELAGCTSASCHPVLSPAGLLWLAVVVLRSYYGFMTTVVKRSISMPAELFERLEHEGAEDGRTMSATLAEAAELWLSTRKGLKAVRE